MFCIIGVLMCLQPHNPSFGYSVVTLAQVPVETPVYATRVPRGILPQTDDMRTIFIPRS